MKDLAQAFAVALAVDPKLITDPMLRARMQAIRDLGQAALELNAARVVASAAQTRVERAAAQREIKRLEARCERVGDRILQLDASASAVDASEGGNARH